MYFLGCNYWITPGCLAMAAVVVGGSPLPTASRGSLFSQAQFMLSPDPVFSETGSVTGIKYCDRFKQYKKLIVKLLETPRMNALFMRINAELFPVDRPDPQPSPSSTGGVTEDEDDFARAFNDDVQGMSASTSVSYSNGPTQVEARPRWPPYHPPLLPQHQVPLSSRP